MPIPPITDLLSNIDPIAYSKTRNFLNGRVTRLSAYLSRGYITLPQVFDHIKNAGYTFQQAEKLYQELAWREYYQRVWEAKGDAIFKPLRNLQQGVRHYLMPKSIMDANTGITAIDKQIQSVYETGYMHNHARMYVAGIACNLAGAYWLKPSRWLYYHLLDADLASNACSWQWVAGCFSAKKYITNQDNVNHYLGGNQKGTFLDYEYHEIFNQALPSELVESCDLELKTTLPKTDFPNLNHDLPLYLYHFYHLDPNWRANELANRVLIFEPSHFEKYPVSPLVIDFVLEMAQTIPGIQVYVGEVKELCKGFPLNRIVTREHPTVQHFPGIKDAPAWMFPEVRGYYPSFFGFWNKAKKGLG